MNQPESDPWIARLTGPQPEKDLAIHELHEYLLRVLTRTMGGKVGLHLEDVVQEAVVRILDKLDTFEQRSKFTTWATTIANRIAISKMRRKHFDDVSLDALKSSHRVEASKVVPNAQRASVQLDRITILKMLNELIATELSDKQRVAMKALLDGSSPAEIAEQTNSNPNAVHKLIHDARLRLKQAFDAANIDSEIVMAVFD